MKPLSKNWKFYRALYDTYEGIQEIRKAAENRLRSIELKMDEEEPLRKTVMLSIIKLKDYEKEIQNLVAENIKIDPIYTEFLSKIKGIGPTLSMKILSFPWDLEKYVTDWYAFAGIVPLVDKCVCEKGHKFLLPHNEIPPIRLSLIHI